MTALFLTIAVVCKIIALTVLFRSLRKPTFSEAYKDETL
jgi:hypothetical protein